jgi:hypothetical protein
VAPDPPQTPLFHLHLRGDLDTLWERTFGVAEQRKVCLFESLAPTVVPGVYRAEVSVGEPALEISPQEAAELFAIVVSSDEGAPSPDDQTKP